MAKRPEEPPVTPSTPSVPAPDNANISFNEQTADWQYDWQKTPFKTEDGRTVDFDRIPSGHTVDGRSVSVGEFGRSFGAGFDPRYYFASGVTPEQANILAMGGKIEGQDVSVPEFAPRDMPSQFLGDAPQPNARDRARELMGDALSDPSHPLNPHRVDPATGEPIRGEMTPETRALLEQRGSERNRAALEKLESDRSRRESEQEEFYAELSRQRQPDFVQQDDDRADAHLRGEDTSPAPPTGPQQTPEEAMLEIAARGRRRDELSREREQFNRMMTERARARRGLPPLDQQARAAAEGGPEAAQAFRGAPQAGVGDLSRMPAVYKDGVLQPPGTVGADIAGQPQSGQYQTGQTVQLKDMPGGHQSTTVYALDTGVALPGGMDMSTEDFGAAFQQLNPGKSKMDAVQALAREPGPTGAAARNLLKDAGAVAGQPLSAAQQEQIQSQLGTRTDELLREHARSMESGIAAGSRRITRQQEEAAEAQQKLMEEEQKRQAEIRKAAMKAAEAKYGTEEYAGRSMESILQEEMEFETSKQRFIAGEGEAPARPVDRSNVFDVPSYEVKPDSVPAEAMPEGAFIDPESGLLKYQNEQLQAPLQAALLDAPGREGGKQVVPIIQNDRQASMLPPGQSYIMDGKLFFRGTPGRPTTRGEDARGRRTTTGRERVTGAADTDAAETAQERAERERIRDIDPVKVEQQLLEQKTSPIKNTIKQIEANIERQKTAMEAMTSEETKADAQLVIDGLEQELATQQEAMRTANTVTDEEIRAEMDRQYERSRQLYDMHQEFAFGKGDPEIVARTANAALPAVTTQLMTRGGSMLDVDGVQVPFTKDDEGSLVIDAQTPEQILAIETNAEGNVITKAMGQTGVDAVSSSVYRDTTNLMADIQKAKKDNSLVMVNGSPSEQQQLIGQIKEYLTAKYNPDQRDMPRLVDGMLEGLGFEAPTPDILAHQQRLQRDQYAIDERATEQRERIDRAEAEILAKDDRGIARQIGDAANRFFGGGFSPNE